jgi:hypothetical protein
MSKLTKLNILNKDVKSIINKYLLPYKKSLDLKELRKSTFYISITIDLYMSYNKKYENLKYKKIYNEWYIN